MLVASVDRKIGVASGLMRITRSPVCGIQITIDIDSRTGDRDLGHSCRGEIGMSSTRTTSDLNVRSARWQLASRCTAYRVCE